MCVRVCRWYGDCVTNTNGDTGFVTALIFSVVTEQTIGLFTLTVWTLRPCCMNCIRVLFASTVLSSKQCLLQVMETHTQISAGLLPG